MPNDRGKVVLSESLSAADASKALQQTLASADKAALPVNERRGLRLPYAPPRAFMEFIPKDGPSANFVVHPRNLSTRGIAVMHRAYVHKDLPCKVLLPRLNGEWVRFEGQVVRCNHVTGKAHEVAVVFHRAVRLAEYMKLSEADATRADEEYEYFRRVPSPTADRTMRDKWPGTAAVVAGKQFNLPVLKTWLNFVGMHVLLVDTLEQILQIRMPLRMVALPADPTLVASAKSRGIAAAIVAVGDVDDNDTYERTIAAGADAFVATCGEFGDLTTVLQTLGRPTRAAT